MSEPHDTDRLFHENLLNLGPKLPAPQPPSDHVRSLCLQALESGGSPSKERKIPMYRRPALLTTLAIAASIALASALLFPTFQAVPTVQAATVLNKLAKQVAGQDVLEVAFDRVTVDDEVSINGRLQLAKEGIAGDLQVKVTDDGEDSPIDVDVSLGFSGDAGWVLVRRLSIPEPEAQVFINMFMPAGTETLIMLPTEVVEQALGKFGHGGFDHGIGHLRSVATGHVTAVVKEILQSQSDVGAKVTKQADGTIAISLVLRDSETIENLMRLAMKAEGHAPEGEDADIDIEEDHELLGAAFKVIYDPKTEEIRSLSVTDLAEMKGTVTLTLRGGAIDAAMLDSSRVTTPQTRVLDLNALLSVAQSLGANIDLGHGAEPKVEKTQKAKHKHKKQHREERE